MKNTLITLLGISVLGAFSFFKAPDFQDNAAILSSYVVQGVTVTVAEAPAPVIETPQAATLDGTQIARRRRRAAKPPAPSAEAQQAAPSPYNIVINVAAYRLRLYENGKLIKVYPVCVGMPGYRSPANGKYAISTLMWNPSWSPPPEADWAKGSAGKGPGKWNPVGLVKMPLKGYVFVHGTYKIKSLGFAWSHGCFRMANEDAVELAWFLQSHVGSNHPEQTLDFYKNNHRTFIVKLNQKVPTETYYDTIEVTDSRLLIHPDVYRMGTNSEERVIEKLKSAGWQTDKVNMNRVRQLLVRSKQETAIANKEYMMSAGN